MSIKIKINRISLKLIGVVALVTIIIIGIYSYFSLQNQKNALQKEFENHAAKISETIVKSTRLSMLENDRPQMLNIIKTIGEEPCIREIRVFNKEGVIIYSNDSTLIGTLVDKKAEGCYACHNADHPLEKLPIHKRTRIFSLNPDSSRILGIMTPIYNEPSCWNASCHVHPRTKKVLGVLDVTMCLKDVDKAQQEAERNLIIFAVVSVIMLSLIIGFFVRRIIGKPVSELLTATKEVSSGNLNYSIEKLSNDELGQLARAFNNMTKKLAQARMQLFQSDKMASLGRLAAGVAHEINNPLTGVLTYSSFLLKRTKDNPEFQEDLKVIVKETKRSREIVKSLLDFARQSVPKKSKADINKIIETSVNVVKNQLAIKKVNLEKDLANNLPSVTVDANQIQQVFINLIVNSADAIENEKGIIKIKTSLVRLAPKGVAQIKNAVCPKRHDLMDNEIKIEGMPTVKLKAVKDDKTVIINFDPIYGSHRHIISNNSLDLRDANILCPKCDVSLIDKDNVCPVCGSKIFKFEVPPYGFFEACTNFECNWERWKVLDDAGEKDYVKISIADNGKGIPQEDLTRIFEPFFSTKGQKGTGLGLAVIWGIIDNHDGTIAVKSEVGKGTEFIIRIPV